ncbi:YrdB family protein [Kribbella sp. NPDC026611]|uniref:YrdB family protein n=1 Tax=Kribbella sp. NPDC026611 TaxID=3154911 RepID=UPI00340BA436
MLTIWKWGNLLLAFLVELVAIGIFAWWGWSATGSTTLRLLLAIGLPALTVVLWGRYAAPTAKSGGPAVRWSVKLLVFGLAGAALWSLGHPVAAVVFVAVVAANLLIIQAQRIEP